MEETPDIEIVADELEDKERILCEDSVDKDKEV